MRLSVTKHRVSLAILHIYRNYKLRKKTGPSQYYQVISSQPTSQSRRLVCAKQFGPEHSEVLQTAKQHLA